MGFTNGWTSSAVGVAYYAASAIPANAQVTRSVNTSSATAPVVTFSVVPGANAACEAVTETLPPGLSATGVSGGGNYIASNNVVVWGPFFGTNAHTLSYTLVGQPGTYPVIANWSVDGAGGTETTGTSLVITLFNSPHITGLARNANGSVTLNFVGLPNTTNRVWAATNLASPVIWLPIFTNITTNPNGTWQFTDTNAAAFSKRFYRFSTP